jgi:hypothetical protein
MDFAIICVLELMAFSSFMGARGRICPREQEEQPTALRNDGHARRCREVEFGVYPVAFDFDASRKPFTPTPDGWLGNCAWL